MISRALPRTQETQVLEAIIAVHLNPYDFDWEQVDSLNLFETRVPRLFHSSRKYFLTFDVEDPDGYFWCFGLVSTKKSRLSWYWEDGSG